MVQRRQSLQPVPEHPNLLDLDGTTLTDAATSTWKRAGGTVFVDTRTGIGEPEAEAAHVADLVIVPVRPSPDDLEAVGETLKILRRLDKRVVMVVNAAKNEVRARDARAALSRYPVPLSALPSCRPGSLYLDASLEGRGVGEMRGGAARTLTRSYKGSGAGYRRWPMSSSRRGRSLAEVMAPIEDEGTARPLSQAAPSDAQPDPDAVSRPAAGRRR